MEWKVIEIIASPDTGTIFGRVETHYGLNYILWFKGEYYLRPGEVITTCKQGILVDNRRRRVWVVHAIPFSSTRWMGLQRLNDCPGNRQNAEQSCPVDKPCRFTLCPFGLKKYLPKVITQQKISSTGVGPL